MTTTAGGHMVDIAGPDEVAHGEGPGLSRVLHPSAGLSSQAALALAADRPAEPARDEAASASGRLAEVLRLEDHPRHTGAHAAPRQPSA